MHCEPWVGRVIHVSASDVFRLGPICQSGVVRGVFRPGCSVVRMAYVLSVSIAMSAGLAMRLVDLVALLGEFDGEQSLHTGVEVEDFTGPAGTNRSGVRVLEAVHPSQLIMLIMLCLPITAA